MDRAIRAILGVVLIYAWYAMWVSGTLGIVAMVIGVVLLLTGIIGWCPLYTLFGFATHKT